MNCPFCLQIKLKKAIFYRTEIDYCPQCLGMWFEADELRQAKDGKDKNLKWLDIDLWQNQEKFEIARDQKVCPACSVPLYEVNYGDSPVKVDLCNLCQGVWLDRKEFKKITVYLREKSKDEILNHYLKTAASETAEIFNGPEVFKEELGDFLVVLKLLSYKFLVQHPVISGIISKIY